LECVAALFRACSAYFREAKKQKGRGESPGFFVCCVKHKNIILSIRASFTPLELDRQAQYLKGAYTYRQGYYSVTPNQ
jgi:hypothetical protein